MAKIIAVQEGLEDIKKELSSLGYIVVGIEEFQNPDAIVYVWNVDEIPYMNIGFSMNAGVDMESGRGAILINAKNKSIDEIERIIKDRLYTQLF